MVGSAFFGVNQLLGSIPMHNTLSYMSGSTASKITANIMTGRNAFDLKLTDAVNSGIIVPAAIDVASLLPPLAQRPINNYLEKNHPKFKVDKIGRVKTRVNEYGDMDLRGEIPGLGPKTIKTPVPSQGKIRIGRFSITHPLNFKTVPITIPLPETIGISIEVQTPFIYNYQSLVQSLIISYK